MGKPPPVGTHTPRVHVWPLAQSTSAQSVKPVQFALAVQVASTPAALALKQQISPSWQLAAVRQSIALPVQEPVATQEGVAVAPVP
jgi:hypothetical protein